MKSYTTPAVKDLGSFAELTLDEIYKSAGTGDHIHIAGTVIGVPGGSVIGIS